MRGKYMTDSAFIGCEDFYYILQQHGSVGLAAKMVLEAKLWQQETLEYPLDSVFKLAPLCGTTPEDLKSIIDTFILLKLFYSDGEVFGSHAIKQEQENVDAKSQQKKDAVNARWSKQKGKDCTSPEPLPNPPVVRPYTDVSQTDTTTGVCVGVSVNKDLKNNGVELIPGFWIDDILREATIATYQTQGLSASDLPQGAIFAQDHYKSLNPNNLRKPWVIRELQSLRINRSRIEKAQSPPGTALSVEEAGKSFFSKLEGEKNA